MKMLRHKLPLCISATALAVSSYAGASECQPPTPTSPLTLEGCLAGDTLTLTELRFATNQSRILPESLGLMDQVAGQLLANPKVKVSIQGHTDSIGAADYNLSLSQNRAQSVVDYLLQRGVNPMQLSAQGFGETAPLASNDTEDGRAVNRRVELLFVGSGVIEAAPPPPVDVYITTFSAQPNTLTVPPGTKVTWHNFDEVSHKIVFDDGVQLDRIWTKGTDALSWGGSTTSRVFDTPGEYSYSCAVYNSVFGKIIVKPVNSVTLYGPPSYPGETTVNLNQNKETVPYEATVTDHGAENAHDWGVKASVPAPDTQESEPTSAEPEAQAVIIQGRAFHPENLTIVAGTPVTWTHEGSSRHKIRFGSEESQALNYGDSYTKVFSEPGDFPYECGIHSSMKGTITVISE